MSRLRVLNPFKFGLLSLLVMSSLVLACGTVREEVDDAAVPAADAGVVDAVAIDASPGAITLRSGRVGPVGGPLGDGKLRLRDHGLQLGAQSCADNHCVQGDVR